ncbi:NrdH-redoxin [Candidatus Pacearchaeota archaeon CG_4_10_14_0_2_um_filter_05_32_18]|nr:MAG: NrdH-redoxin [Candidatus Pacearchaeota archaeon CG_4_10_14_0_2_um_filter_05_32_18]
MMKIIIYGTDSCPWCHKAREFMKEHKVKFTDKNVGEDQKAAQEMIKKSGQQGVPVIDVDGEIIVGFDEDRLRNLLKIK